MYGTKARRTRNLRYKRPALASLGYHAIQSELGNIRDACADIHWFTDQDDDTLLNALDGDEDETWEFKMAFSDLEARADRLDEVISEYCGWGSEAERLYNDCTVALIGNRYKIIGFDCELEDYFSLISYEEGLAQTEAGKRLMRMTKAEMISTIGQCFGILLAFLDVRQQYDYLKATFDILRDENTSLLQTIKEIDAASGKRKYVYYVCAAHKEHKTCSAHSLRDTALDEIVLEALKKHIRDVIDLADLLELTDTAQLQQAGVRKLQARLDRKREEIDRNQALLGTLYESLADGLIDRDEYQDLKKTYSRRRSEAEAQAEAIQEEMSRELEQEDRGWMEQFRKHRNITELERSIIVTLVERILIFRGHRVEIIYRWHNEFRSQMDLLLQAQKLSSGKEAV